MTPMLYILMRTDLDSLNPGKAIAQGAHAANQFVSECGNDPDVQKWTRETSQGFGTTIVLAVEDADALHYYTSLADDDSIYNGITHDPSYPIRDGKVVHTIPLDTCGYVFSPNGPLDILSKLNLHP
jgi:peptidyl-tRNA hydrolase